MTVYYNRPSDRVSGGEPNRIMKNFRLHRPESPTWTK